MLTFRFHECCIIRKQHSALSHWGDKMKRFLFVLMCLLMILPVISCFKTPDTIPVYVNVETVIIVKLGSSTTIEPSSTPSGASFSFSSSDSEIASVDSSGKVTGKSIGEATITINATKPGYDEGFVTVTVIVTSAKLSSIKYNGTPVEGFSPDTYRYSVALFDEPTGIPEIEVTPIDPRAVVKISEPTEIPGAFVISVAAFSAELLQYRVEFFLAANMDATLKSLTVSQGTLNPPFDKNTLTYSVNLPAGTTVRPTVSAEPSQPDSSVVIDHSPSLPGTTTITVTAPDGETTKQYTVSFSVADSTDATLQELKYNGTMVPGFNKNVTSYSVQLPYGTESITVTAKASHPEATISYDPSAEIDVPGAVDVIVTAQDGVTTKTYSVAFTVAQPGSDASLKSLTVSPGSLSPNFDPNVTSYSVVVPYGTKVSDISISASPNDPDANITITEPTSLPGQGTVVVTAQDGTTQRTYTISFTEAAPSDDANLKSLNVTPGTMNPSFSPTTYDYDVVLPYGTTVGQINISASTNHPGATRVITKPSSIPGDGTVVVTAEDGTTTRTYTISFTEAPPSRDATLKSLSVSPGTLQPSFNPNTTEYSVELPHGTTVGNITITAAVNHSRASLVITKPSSLPGTGTVVVTAEDGITTKTYTIDFTVSQIIPRVIIQNKTLPANSQNQGIDIIIENMGELTAIEIALEYDPTYLDWTGNYMRWIQALDVAEKVDDKYIYIALSNIDLHNEGQLTILTLYFTTKGSTNLTYLDFSSFTLSGGLPVSTSVRPNKPNLDLTDRGRIKIQ